MHGVSHGLSDLESIIPEKDSRISFENPKKTFIYAFLFSFGLFVKSVCFFASFNSISEKALRFYSQSPWSKLPHLQGCLPNSKDISLFSIQKTAFI